MRIPIILLLLLAGAAAAQPASGHKTATQQKAWPLESLTIKGNRLYTSQQIIALTGLKIGQMVSEADFDAARQRLLATGAFESIAFGYEPARNGKGYAAHFDLSEFEQVYPFRFDRLPATSAEMTRYLEAHEPLFGSKIPATTQLLDRYANDLQKLLVARGFKDKVIARLTSDAPGVLVVVFRPRTPPPAIASVAFTGNQVLPNPLLHTRFAQIAVGVPYSVEMVRQMLNTTIRPLYEARGRLRVQFVKIEAEPAKDVDGVAVKVQVEEGPSYKFGTIHVDSNTLGERNLLKIARLTSGTVADFDAVHSAVERMQKEFHASGYMNSDIKVARTIDDANKTVNVVFETNSGPQFMMGNLIIKGLDIESEPVMRKTWGLPEGKPFDAGYPAMFCEQIKEGGYFDNLKDITSSQKVNDADDTVDVTLNFIAGGPKPGPKQDRRHW
jgi:outer membrane protein insertion porin family